MSIVAVSTFWISLETITNFAVRPPRKKAFLCNDTTPNRVWQNWKKMHSILFMMCLRLQWKMEEEYIWPYRKWRGDRDLCMSFVSRQDKWDTVKSFQNKEDPKNDNLFLHQMSRWSFRLDLYPFGLTPENDTLVFFKLENTIKQQTLNFRTGQIDTGKYTLSCKNGTEE